MNLLSLFLSRSLCVAFSVKGYGGWDVFWFRVAVGAAVGHARGGGMLLLDAAWKK